MEAKLPHEPTLELPGSPAAADTKPEGGGQLKLGSSTSSWAPPWLLVACSGRHGSLASLCSWRLHLPPQESSPAGPPALCRRKDGSVSHTAAWSGSSLTLQNTNC